MLPNIIGHRIERASTTPSTNSWAREYLSEPDSHGMVLIASHQSEGRGQKGSTWESESGKNITLSIILRPTFLKHSAQFLISKAVSLAVCDTLQPIADVVSIKWPNDIYVNDRKIAGILVENTVVGGSIESSIVGIGLNVNQMDFSDEVPNPTSVVMELGRTMELDQVLWNLCNCLNRRYNQLQEQPQEIEANYLQSLYRRDNFYPYHSGGKVFNARIFDVKTTGELMLETEHGDIVGYQIKQVAYSL